ncbi:hypothetical protein [Brevibacterium album]|uniref:hypothetical protein n=1 Tax=Brevibacterium album TaxID=417948 RepID=UPI00048DD536|nr:hypothetical protein [Brevibacterium album]
MRTSTGTTDATLTQTATTGDALSVARHPGWARLIIGYLAVAAVVPYLTLKLLWILGSTAGILAPSPLDPAVVQSGNIVTAVMELVAVAIILTFTHSWGLKVPAWLVLIPAWIGIGLLAPFIVNGPAVAGSVLTGLSPAGDGSLAPWVGPLVYLGFGAQAIGIAASFVLYARDRWNRVLTGRLAERCANPSKRALLFLGWGVGLLLAVVSTVRLCWSLGATWGLSAHMIQSRGLPERLADGTSALFAAAALAGLLMLTLKVPGRWRVWVPLSLAWVGGGATLTGGLYSLALLTIRLMSSTTPVHQTGVDPLVDLIQVVAGTAIGTAGAVLLSELHQTVSTDRG